MKQTAAFVVASVGLAICSAADPVTIELQPILAPHASRRAAGKPSLRLKRAASQLALTDWISTVDLQWYGTISVGTPPQNL